MVGVRLHSLIFATAAEIPVVGISYDPKVDSFLGSIGESCVFNIEKIDENQLYDEINYKLRNRSLNNDKIKKLKKSVNNNMVIINKLLS
jgi:polysaccharide pyruvyl transferase WcaK-like protein